MTNIVTIDGLASSGKTSAGLMLANVLGYKFMDSGSIYRAGCLNLLRAGLPTNDKSAASIFESMDLSFSSTPESYHVFLSDEDVTELLGSPEITKIVPVVGSYENVRSIVRDRQRNFAIGKNVVVTGRDVGSEIFPEAAVKYYLTADAETRARRRFNQNLDSRSNYGQEEILNDIRLRDHLDLTRKVSPSRIPEGARIIDTSELSLGEVVNLMHATTVEHLKEVQNKEGKSSRSSEML